MDDIARGLIGMAGLLVIAWILSLDRRKITPRTVLGALAIQTLFAIIVLYWPAGKQALAAVSSFVQRVIDASAEGIAFVFGSAIPAPDEGFVFAFQVLPVIIFFASLMAVLYYLNILQKVVQFLGGALSKLLLTSKPESVSATANIFVGQTEAPLVVKPYLAKMTTSEIFAVMTGGLATVAGSVLAGYALLGANLDYLIAASFMAAPGGLLMAKMIVPAGAGEEPATADELQTAEALAVGDERVADPAAAEIQPVVDHPGSSPAAGTSIDEASLAEEEAAVAESKPHNVIDAAAMGASDGLKLALNVGAMLIAFISLVALLNNGLGTIGGWIGVEDLSFELILGYVFAPVMFLIGVPLDEAVEAGSYLGQKLVLNEFVAFSNFAPNIEEFTPKTAAIITFALTGFANLGSLAILLGGLGTLAPNKRPIIARLGLRAIAAGTLANLMSAALAGALIAT